MNELYYTILRNRINDVLLISSNHISQKYRISSLFFCLLFLKILLKRGQFSLAGLAPRLERQPADWRAPGFIAAKGRCLSCRLSPRPRRGRAGGSQSKCLTSDVSPTLKSNEKASARIKKHLSIKWVGYPESQVIFGRNPIILLFIWVY